MNIRDEHALTATATFRVSGILKLGQRPGIYICGEIVDGIVKAGQSISWPLHGDNLTMPLRIQSVESVDYAPGTAGIALGVRFEEAAEDNEQLVRSLCESGMIVRITDYGPSE